MSIKAFCLGVGNGTSYVLRGVPSSAFVILLDEKPFLLVDCGAGIALAYQKHFTQPPQHIYLTHNHMDHTGDFPIFLLHTVKQINRRLNVYGHTEVLDIIRTHRLHELYTAGIAVDELVNWVCEDPQFFIHLPHDIQLRLFKSKHSYLCYGFVLYHSNRPILGYTADSAFDKKIYDTVTKAPIVIADGRSIGNDNHASFEEIERYASIMPSSQFYITHHEDERFSFSVSNVQFLVPDQEITLS